MTDNRDEVTEGGEDQGPLFSLVSGEGDGFMLGLAAGDTAGGTWELGYSALTEQATVISYQLIETREVDADRLVAALGELDGLGGDEPVLRSVSPHLRGWLDRAASGRARPSTESSTENLVRTVPVGAFFRRDADELIGHAAGLGRVFNQDSPSVTAGVIGACAVAAAAFGQSGRDLVAGVAEAVLGAMPNITTGTTPSERVEDLERVLSDVMERVGPIEGDFALQAVGGSVEDPLAAAAAGLLLAAPVSDRPHVAVAEAARIGGSVLGAFVGAVVGSRAGIRAWPWAFANDTWFAEIGRRVVRGPGEVRDLPIPYAVEEHLMSGASHEFR